MKLAPKTLNINLFAGRIPIQRRIIGNSWSDFSKSASDMADKVKNASSEATSSALQSSVISASDVLNKTISTLDEREGISVSVSFTLGIFSVSLTQTVDKATTTITQEKE